MSKLLIEQMTEQVELTKTAEEAQLEKVAHITNVIDQAQTLSLVGEELYKIAEEMGNEDFAALASDTYELGARMGACLTKTASDSSVALEEAMEIADDLYKVAEVICGIADEIGNEDFNKLAEAVVNISNEMTTDANEVIEKEAAVSAAGPVRSGLKGLADRAGLFGRGAVQHTKDAVKEHGTFARSKSVLAEATKNTNFGAGLSKTDKIKALLGTKEGLKAVGKDTAPYAAIAAALGGAGYATKKHYDKKK